MRRAYIVRGTESGKVEVEIRKVNEERRTKGISMLPYSPLPMDDPFGPKPLTPAAYKIVIWRLNADVLVNVCTTASPQGRGGRAWAVSNQMWAYKVNEDVEDKWGEHSRELLPVRTVTIERVMCCMDSGAAGALPNAGVR